MKYKPFLQWWLFITVISLSIFYGYYKGLLETVLQVDITYITVVILGLFSLMSFQIGYQTFKICKYNETNFDVVPVMNWADRLPTLGIIGTVVGLIFLFSTAKLDAGSTQIIIKGMGTALYTTAAGLICKLLLDLQLDNFLKCEGIICKLNDNQII